MGMTSWTAFISLAIKSSLGSASEDRVMVAPAALVSTGAAGGEERPRRLAGNENRLSKRKASLAGAAHSQAQQPKIWNNDRDDAQGTHHFTKDLVDQDSVRFHFLSCIQQTNFRGSFEKTLFDRKSIDITQTFKRSFILLETLGYLTESFTVNNIGNIIGSYKCNFSC